MKRFSTAIVGFMAAIGFSSCVHYQLKPISAEITATDFSQRTLVEVSLKAFLETNLHTGECEVLHGLKRELRGIYRLVKNKNPSTLKRYFSGFSI